jgi:predicted transcriptional regulator
MKKDNAEFNSYCQIMYSENCLERIEYGQKPYKSLKAYLTKNYNFIVDRFEKGKRPWSM